MRLRVLATIATLSATCSACKLHESDYAKQIKATGLARVAVGYAELGQKDKASELLAQALRTAKAIENEIVLTEVAIRYAEVGQYNQALQTAKAMQE